MSKNYVKAVLDHLPGLTSPTDALVLLAIAEYTSDETRIAWPSIRALMRRTRLDRRTVQRTLRHLEVRGLVSTTTGGQIEKDHEQLVNAASCYRLQFDHNGVPLQDKAPPKRALRRVEVATARAAAPPITPKSQTTTPAAAAVPSPRMKKVATAEPARDLSEEKQRQLAAIRKKLSP